MSARGIREAEVWRTEQIEHYARTTDPPNHSVGDEWLRTDIQPVADAVAELRIHGPGGVLQAPVFDPSVTLGSDVYVGRRYVFSDGTEGHLLVTDQGGAVGSPRILTSAGTLYETHDAVEVNAIPDSVVIQYYSSSWNLGDANLIDDAGNVNLSISGGPSAGTLSDGADAIITDGVDDSGEFTVPSSLEGGNLKSFSLEFALQYTHTNEENWMGIRQGNGNGQWLHIYSNRDELNSSDVGNFHLLMRDTSNNMFRCAPSSNPNINDGNRHNISFIINDTTTPDVSIIIDGADVPVSYGSQDSLTNFGTWDRPMQLWARDLDGSIGRYFENSFGAFRWHDSAIAAQTIGDYS